MVKIHDKKLNDRIKEDIYMLYNSMQENMQYFHYEIKYWHQSEPILKWILTELFLKRTICQRFKTYIL